MKYIPGTFIPKRKDSHQLQLQEIVRGSDERNKEVAMKHCRNIIDYCNQRIEKDRKHY